jgi:hypothetical protein
MNTIAVTFTQVGRLLVNAATRSGKFPNNPHETAVANKERAGPGVDAPGRHSIELDAAAA